MWRKTDKGGIEMKQVFVIIRPNMYYKTKDALVENGFYSMIVKDALGRGKKPADFTLGNGDKVSTDISHPFVAKKMIEIFCRDEELDKLLATIKSVNQTKNAGDGKIFIINIEDCIRIRTGESGNNALV